eukprot:1157162-Amorphochlora_amoeboformis.AAC.1
MVVFPARSVAAWGFSFGIIIFFAYYSTAPLPLRRPVAQIVTRGSVAPRFSSPKRIFKPWFGKTRTCQRAISQNKWGFEGNSEIRTLGGFSFVLILVFLCE